MKKEELIEQTACLIAVCKMTYSDIVKELTKLVSSIESSAYKDETPKVITNEKAKEYLKCNCERPNKAGYAYKEYGICCRCGCHL